MRCLFAVPFLFACGRPLAFPAQSLPELVSAVLPTTPLAATGLTLPPGESLIWSVHWKGLTIGRAELGVSDHDVRSRFKTDALASTVFSVDYELLTVLDRAAACAISATEKLAINGDTTQVAATFDVASYAIDGQTFALPDGNRGHTLHSALGAVRAWAQPDAPAGFLFILHAGQLVRLDVARPVAEELQGTKTLRVEGRVHSQAQAQAQPQPQPQAQPQPQPQPQDDKRAPFSITVWLTDDQKRTPIRIEVKSANASADERITAELIDTAAG